MKVKKVNCLSLAFERFKTTPHGQTRRKHVRAWIVLAGAVTVTAQPLKATLIITYAESPTAVNSTISNTAVIHFSTLATSGANAYSNLTWTDSTLGAIGTIDHVYLQTANMYGGANYTAGTTPTGYYPVQSDTSGVGGSKAVAVILSHSARHRPTLGSGGQQGMQRMY
jgi:hypothetical protein